MSSSSFSDHEFISQWAIRMPNGKLYGSRTYNPHHEMMEGLFGGFGMVVGFAGDDEDEAADEVITSPPTVWYDRKEAERCLAAISEQARMMGIEYWGGTIVERLCSPFTVDSQGAGIPDEITRWLRDQ